MKRDRLRFSFWDRFFSQDSVQLSEYQDWFPGQLHRQKQQQQQRRQQQRRQQQRQPQQQEISQRSIVDRQFPICFLSLSSLPSFLHASLLSLYVNFTVVTTGYTRWTLSLTVVKESHSFISAKAQLLLSLSLSLTLFKMWGKEEKIISDEVGVGRKGEESHCHCHCHCHCHRHQHD